MIKRIVFILTITFLIFFTLSCKKKTNKYISYTNDSICRINLFTSSGSYDKRFLMLNFGHSFISIENLSNKQILIGEYLLDIDEEITISIWPITSYKGVWYNLESSLINNTNKYSDRISVSFDVNEGTLDEINLFLKESKSWSIFYNCSGFTLDIYNIITKNTYKPLFVSPTALLQIFKQYDYTTCKKVKDNINIGYFKEGDFEKCDLSY